ncbi:MAG: hypothetical protein ACI9CU_000337, partial [Polaribacter sp.]
KSKTDTWFDDETSWTVAPALLQSVILSAVKT